MNKTERLLITHEEYLQLPYVSNSSITQRIKYPHGFIKINDGLPSMQLGTLLHEFILEPEKETDYKIRSTDDKRTGIYKTETEVAQEEGLKLISKKDYENVMAMKKVVNESEMATKLLTEGYKENTLLFELQNIECKCKPDNILIKKDSAIVVDLKTIYTLDSYLLNRHCRDYGYHRQAYFYSYAVSQHFDIPMDKVVFVNVFVETPSDTKLGIGCYCAAFDDETLLEAEMEILNQLNNWENNSDIRRLNLR